MIRIAHCQYEALCGEFDRNLARFAEGLARADSERATIVSFPECFLTGYPDRAEEARSGAFSIDSEKMMRVLDISSQYEALGIVGFNELRGEDLYNTAAVVHRGHLLGLYSKCAAYQKFHKQGRDFPVWTHQSLTFGVIICADGGYIEPARILALKGARVIFAPHFNAIAGPHLLGHFMKVRADHAARANENGVYFVRGNNVILNPAASGISNPEVVGYGDSY
ncbi:MAG: carbon-nitrogen hydrolase family protein, partial [Verrucomicrobiales bacterium]